MEHARTGSIAVLGGGIAGFAAAAAFRRALPETQVTIYAGDGAAGEAEYPGAAAPSVHAFHRLVGIDPELFRRRTGAVTAPEAEIRRAGRPPVRLVPLAEIPHVDGAGLHQLWLRRTASDPSAGPAWADVARRARRPGDLADGLGVRFNAAAYLALLGEVATHLGVTIAREAAGSAELAATHDLVIDTRSRGADEAGWQRIEGVPGGCDWSVTDVGRSAEPIETIGLAERYVSWASAVWRAEARIEPDAVAAGRVIEPWQGNVLAVGRAAAHCETFDGQPLAVALADIARALELLPRPGASGRETAEYNRRSGMVHDFLLDWAAERWGPPAQLPPGLAALRAQFAHRGRIPFRDEDPVPQGQWIGWLLGRGERPRHLDLTAVGIPEAQLVALFAGV